MWLNNLLEQLQLQNQTMAIMKSHVYLVKTDTNALSVSMTATCANSRASQDPAMFLKCFIYRKKFLNQEITKEDTTLIKPYWKPRWISSTCQARSERNDSIKLITSIKDRPIGKRIPRPSSLRTNVKSL